MNQTTQLEQLATLVDLFEFNYAQYKSTQYDESNTRTDFIDKFFSILGWDVANNNGYSELYRDVIREDKVRIEGKQKAPDYSFRIGGAKKFFVEAKKPSVNIKEDKDSAFQVRRYGYTAKLPLSILTNFDGFAVYDTRIKPSKDDKASTARVFFCQFREYKNNFKFIEETFSKEAVLKGSFDKYIEDNKKKRGTSEVDKELLALIEGWRIEIAKTIAIRNAEIDIYNLNLAVQKVIDRIIFLRIAEDKEIEEYGQLLDLLKGGNIYSKLNDIFIQANAKYNSGLFEQEEWLTNLVIDDKALSGIIKGLYYPECPYEFSILPIEILGNIYEQFLGKVIQFKNIKGGHTAIIEEKPEVRKAGGVYYTPQYIVSHIIRSTIGKCIKGKTIEDISEYTICDPSCGSGSFLVSAYQYLLNHHLEYYTKDMRTITNSRKNNKIYEFRKDSYRLTIAEKQRILTTHIYGVDIDPQAVEVTKLSLYLKLMEDENQESQGSLFKHSDLKLLPTLDENIKCGNTLIDEEYFDNNPTLFDFNAIRTVNAFNWVKQFMKIFKLGGFDCIIGNPPYVDVKILNNVTKAALAAKFKSASRRFDLYIPFIEKSLSLIKSDGVVAFIMPSMFLVRDYGNSIREILAQSAHMREIIHFGTNQIFDGAMNYVGIFIIDKADVDETAIHKFIDCNFTSRDIELLFNGGSVSKKHRSFTLDKKSLPSDNYWYLQTSSEQGIATLFKRHSPLSSYLDFASEGIHSGKDSVFFVDSKKFLRSSIVYPLAKGGDIHRYMDADNAKYAKRVIYPYDTITGNVINEGDLRSNHPDVYAYLIDSREKLKGRAYFDASSKEWYELWCQRNPRLYTEKKILGPEITNTGNFTLSCRSLFFNNKVKSLVPKRNTKEEIEYLLGVLNSKLLVYLHKSIAPPKGGNYFEVKTAILATLPIKKVDFNSASDKSAHDEIVGHVKQVLLLHSKLTQAISKNDKEIISQQIKITENKIDKVVYTLYDCNSDDIKLIEDSLPID